MKVLIIEDEAPAYRRLEKLIKECDTTAEIVGIIQSVEDGIEWFKMNPLPDLIFSDIQLADDLSFTIYKQLNITIPIIFITAFDEYAINAFEFFSIDYLLKPINEASLRKSLEKYNNIQQRNVVNNFDALVKKLEERKFRERFLVYSGDSLIPLSSRDIAFFHSADGATMLITLDDKRYFVPESLDTLEEELNPTDFFRVNRQFIVASNTIVKIHNFGNQKLKLQTKPVANEDIIISKLRTTAFKSWLGK